MIIRFILLGILLASTHASAAERYRLQIDLRQGETIIERGRALVTEKQRTWSKGLQRSYLKLQCKQLESGKKSKSLSSVDHFAGLRVTHQLVKDNVELTVVRIAVQPRMAEIHALTKNECKDLLPIITKTTLTYSFPAGNGNSEARPFGESMIFRAALQSIGISG